MMQLKKGVVLAALGPEDVNTVYGTMIAAVEKVWAAHWWGNPTVTGGIDGTHMTGSHHYLGTALDFRFPKWPQQTPELIDEAIADLKILLPLYDIVKENSHIHCELR